MNSRSASPSRSKFDRRKTQKASKITKKMIKLDDFINALTDEQFDEAQERHKLKYFRSRVKGKTLKNKIKHNEEDAYDTLPSKPYEGIRLSRVSSESEPLYPSSYESHDEALASELNDLNIISNDSPKWKLEEDIVYSPKVRFGGAGIKHRNVKKRNTKKRTRTNKKRKAAKKY